MLKIKKSNAGRKPIANQDEKKQPVTVYVKGSIIKALGGLNEAKNKSLKALENEK